MAAALSRARLWPPRELLLLACALVQLAAAVPNPQQVLEAADSITDGVPVNSSAQLHQAVSALPPNQGIVLLLEGDLNLSDAWWAPTAPLKIGPNQTVVLRGARLEGPVDLASSPDALRLAGASILDWAQKEEVFHHVLGRVQVEGGIIMLDGVISQNAAPKQPWLDRVNPELAPTGIALEPSVLFDPGSTYVTRFALVDYLSTDCEPSHIADLVDRLQRGVLKDVELGRPNATSYSVNGSATLEAAVTKAGNLSDRVGTVTLVSSNSVANCQLDPRGLPLWGDFSKPPPAPAQPGSSQDSGSGSSDGSGGAAPWVWVLTALGACALLAAAAVAAVLVTRRRRQRGGRGRGSDTLPVVATLPACRSKHSSSGTPGNGQQQGDDSSSLKSPSEKASMASMEPAVALLPNGLAMLQQLQAAWPARFRQLEGLELLGVLDRGGFATVFKARWNGATVAAKVIEHPGGGDVLRRIEREAALATSLSHPHVVCTYQVCTLGPADLRHLLPKLEAGLSTGLATGQEASGQEAAAGLQAKPPAAGSASGHSSSAPFQLPPGRQEATPGAPNEETLYPAAAEPQPAPACLSLAPSGTEHLTFPEAAASGEDGSGPGPSPPSGPAATLIVMEFCDRGSLEGALQRRDLLWEPDGTPRQAAVLRLLIDVAAGLEYLHSVGIVHGDVTPANVLLKSEGRTRRGYCAKLGDFGLARMLEEAQTSAQAPSLLGTASHIAPEVMAGGGASRAADCWSFGLLMWEAWTGQRAFEGLSLPVLSYRIAHLGERPPVPPNCPPDYVALMQRCLQQEAAARPPMAEVAQQLRGQLTGLVRQGGGGAGEEVQGSARKGAGGSGATSPAAC